MFKPGDKVTILENGDQGVVVDEKMDDDSRLIRENAIAVQVENGQGVWGFYPFEIRLTRAPLRYDGVLPTGPDDQDYTA